MESMKRYCCKRWWQCCGSHPTDDNVADNIVLTEDHINQLLADIEQTMQNGREAKNVPMSEGVHNYAAHLQKHLNKVVLGTQISKDALNALGTLHWVGAGLTIIAMGLDMALKTLDNKEQCNDIMKESLAIWKKVMKPVLEKKGTPSDFMRESMGLIIESYLFCKNLRDSTTLKRFICASCHEKELETWKKKVQEFLLMASAVTIADVHDKLSLPPTAPPITSATTVVGFEGRKSDVLKLLKLEDAEETRVVVLHGMGGLGKSTLAEAVYKQVSISRERRHCRIELGEKPSKDHIASMQRQMVEKLTGQSLMMERDVEAIKDKLRAEVLMSQTGQPVLIFIDNVLESEDLEELLPLDCELIALPKGSRLLVTTRDESVCTNVFERNRAFKVQKYKVKVLNASNARQLFCLHAFGQEEPSSEVVEQYDDGRGLIQEMVGSICGNLPLALRVLGRSLYGMSVHSWRKKYDDLKTSGKLELGARVTNVLKSSYDNLDPETQSAFLMVCVCLYDVPYVLCRDVVESIFPKATITRLLDLSLLERRPVSSEEVRLQVKMHDLVRNLGYQMAVARGLAPSKMLTCNEDFLDLNDEISWSAVKWLQVPALEEGIEAELLDKCKELEVLLLCTHVNSKHIHWIPPQHLKVFISSVVHYSVLVEVGKLEELVFLYVDFAKELEFLVMPLASRRLQVFHTFCGASISKEAVDLHKTTLRKLSCRQTAEISPYFCEQMTKLEQLSLLEFQGESLPEDMGSLGSLETLKISSSKIEELPPSLAHLKRLRNLFLELQKLKELPSGVLGGMKQLVRLQLSSLERVTCMPMEDIGQLASLEALELVLPSVERLMSTRNAVVKLEKLKFFSLYCETLSSVEGVRLSCPLLECLHLRLERLEVLPSGFVTESTNLQSLRIVGCDSLREVSAETEMLRANTIQSLVFERCAALKAIPEGVVKAVQRLAVVECPGVAQLPGDVDACKAASMQWLACDSHLLPPQFLSLPPVLPYSPGDWRARRQIAELITETVFAVATLSTHLG